MNPYSEQVKTESRIKRMKMSGYFRRPNAHLQLFKRYSSTAKTLEAYDRLNADLDDFAQPVVKLRLKQSKSRQRRSREHKADVLDADEHILAEKSVEIENSLGIFHDNDHGLKHEMIDTAKARQIVTALKLIKK